MVLMAAEKCVIRLMGAMDRLWFHQIILFPEPSLCPLSGNPKTPSESPHSSSKNSSQMSVISEQEISPLPSVVNSPQDETSSQESETTHDEERKTRLNLFSSKTRFHSSSPKSAQKQSRNLACSTYSEGKLRKTMSCKSLVELELEEVKGFMDLGFIFRKENLSKRIKSLIPGLQRLDDACKNKREERFEFTRISDDSEDEEDKGVMRPYLSEAWLIKRPDSSLLNLRIPTRVSTTADMKKHLKSWARTVASAIQQES